MATDITSLSLGTKIDFSTYDVKIFGKTSFKGMTIVATTQNRGVRAFGSDPRQIYQACVPFIPNGVLPKYDDWEYVVLEDASGQIQAFPIPAIRSESIAVSKPVVLTIKVENAKIEDVDKIVHAINALGYDSGITTSYE